jgi:hypothetical protein
MRQMRFKPSGYLRHGRVARLVFSDPNEAAATGDLEGSPGAVDGIGNIHASILALRCV